jgi:hypothetical protein
LPPAFTEAQEQEVETVLKTIRNILTGAMVAALGATGVSYATTGSLNPVTLVTTAAQDTPHGTSVESSSDEPKGSPEADAQDPKESHGPQRVGCPGFTGKNHGQYVSKSPKGNRKVAAKSDCGKPVNATEEKDKTEAAEPSETPEIEQGDNGQNQTGEHQDQNGPGEHGKSGQTGDQGNKGHGSD